MSNQLRRITKLLKICQPSNKVLLGLQLTTNGENNKSAFFLLDNHYIIEIVTYFYPFIFIVITNNTC